MSFMAYYAIHDIYKLPGLKSFQNFSTPTVKFFRSLAEEDLYKPKLFDFSLKSSEGNT